MSSEALHSDQPRPLVRNRTDGYVIECNGEKAVIHAETGPSATASDDYWTVGQLISIQVATSRVVGLVYKVEVPNAQWVQETDQSIHIHVELVGQVNTQRDGTLRFSSGIATYPHMGAIAHRIRTTDLATIYSTTLKNTVSVGHLSQNAEIPALISIDSLVSRHFAVLGSTGVGKSSAVSLLLRKIISERPDLRVLILDPHNEFASAFPEHAISIDYNTFELPYWLFRLEEFAEAVFRGRPTVAAEVDALRDLIPLARERFASSEATTSASLLKKDRDYSSMTADTPTPYRMADLIKLIEERIGQLDGKPDRPTMKALKQRLQALVADPRYRFMFSAPTTLDTMRQTIGHIFRIPKNDRPICVFQLAGLPSEVVNSVASVLCRMAFDLAVSSDGRVPTLVVCEEAHRYIPADANAGFWPTRQAIARIAKEGRKYGVYLAVITQRPGELDSTILSQCSTVFAMRLGNERDQEIIRSAITGASQSTIGFLSSIANREAIAFGEAVPTPMRMMFETIAPDQLPAAHMARTQQSVRLGDSHISLDTILMRMRQLNAAESTSNDDAADNFETIISSPIANQRPSAPLPQEPVRSQWRNIDAAIRKEEAPKPQPESTERFRASDLIRTFRNDKS
ncbi:ATP-binding protein [Phyllobacterium zundukense]|uniref:ATPase n=1 Tax=Phyllobacterium zundukense TaxID=1867719 RepID=A0A2N9W2I5_9HYPH|nr:ATP-binding protein [Phyllobacterium zundukense]ATU91080.1 ATPase [Phyllobacterium zundukense]PIO45953.1 ATPase [Phyllobacterium zundukense]